MVKKYGSKRLKRILMGVIIAAVVFSIVSLGITKLVYDNQFPRYDRHDETVTAGLRYSDLEQDYPRRLFDFMSGHNRLQGYLYGEENDLGLVVVAHGIGGGADSYLPQITWFVDQGWRVLAFDATGSFDSEGKTTRGFPQALLDLDAALTHIDAQPELNDLPLLLFGHSWGGYAVANILHYSHEIAGVVSVSGANSPMDMILEQGRRMMGSLIYLQSPYLWLYQRILFGPAVSFAADDAIRATNVPVMLIHGTADEMIDYSGSAIMAHLSSPRPAHVRLISRDQPDRNGHNSLFRSAEAIAYFDAINQDYREIYERYEQNIPYAVRQDFYATLDRAQVQQLDEALMQEMHAFFLNCLPAD